MCVCVCVCVCVCDIPLYIFVFAAKIRVWSCLVTDNFGLFAEIPVWLAVVWPENLFIFPLFVFRHFSAAFCKTHCALDLARNHAP